MASGPSWLVWAVYFPMGALGAAWSYFARGQVFAPDGPAWLGSVVPFPVAVGLALALGLSVLTIALTRLLVARTEWARALHLTLRGALLGTPSGRVALLAILSATSEELLFRAALVPQLGLLLSSVLFGMLHVSPRGTYLGWALWATVMGLCFGVLFLASGSLLPAMLAHAIINYENMQYIIHYDPTPLHSDRLT